MRQSYGISSEKPYDSFLGCAFRRLVPEFSLKLSCDGPGWVFGAVSASVMRMIAGCLAGSGKNFLWNFKNTFLGLRSGADAEKR